MSFSETLLDWLLSASIVGFLLSTVGLALASWFTILWMDRNRTPRNSTQSA